MHRTEVLEVINRPKFDFIPKSDKEEFFKMLVEISELVESPVRLSIIEEDERDNRVLECAVSGEVDFIVSGDVHLLRLKKFGNIKIITCKDILIRK